MTSRYEHLNPEELLRLLEARDRRDATRFGLVWEADEIERDKALNNDFVALDLVREQSVGSAPWRNLIINTCYAHGSRIQLPAARGCAPPL